MSAVLSWAADDGLPAQGFAHASRSRPRRSVEGALPLEVEQAVWHASDLGHAAGSAVSSGFTGLDAELPGSGWPTRALTEILCPQPSVLEWRLIGPALQGIVAAGGHVVVIGPPKTPHLPGLRHCGIDEHHLVWVQAEAPAERLWCTEQLIKSGACAAVVSWLPQARPEQIRRLQVCAQACNGPVFLFRPAAAQHEASAAPLRVFTTFGLDWALQVQVIKRRGPAHDGIVTLPSVPGGLQSVLTPRLLRPSQLVAARSAHREPVHALGSNAPAAAPRRSAAVR